MLTVFTALISQQQSASVWELRGAAAGLLDEECFKLVKGSDRRRES